MYVKKTHRDTIFTKTSLESQSAQDVKRSELLPLQVKRSSSFGNLLEGGDLVFENEPKEEKDEDAEVSDSESNFSGTSEDR